jgi:hypothetical protein
MHSIEAPTRVSFPHVGGAQAVAHDSAIMNWRIVTIVSRSLPHWHGYPFLRRHLAPVAPCDNALVSQIEGKSRAMGIRVWAGAVLMMAAPAIVWAQRPLTYPLRSQSPSTQVVDEAYCYWQAKKQTNVDTVRQPQRPFRTTPITFASDAGHGTSEPPLPASAAAASAAAPPGAAASAGASQPATSAASGAGAASGPSAATASSGEAKLPPLPPPEPPMTAYWRAFGDCMQSRGYGVR